jgi:hypothetical protein
MACLIHDFSFRDDKDIGSQDIGQVAQKLAENLDEMDLDQVNSDGEDNMPIFTPELARLKAKEKGEAFDEPAADGDDQMDADEGEESGDDEGEVKEKYPDEFSDSEEEKEDYTIRKTDSLIVAATAQNDHSNLEVYIYEHEKANMYVHHEVILGAYPLCLEWLP